MKLWTIDEDVCGSAYQGLLSHLIEEAFCFGLVWREQFDFADSAHAIRSSLGPHELITYRLDAFPGNKLIGHFAEVVLFECHPDAQVVLEKPGSLFSWLNPAFPEDLFFLSKGGEVLFATVTHEGEGWILCPSLAERVGELIPLQEEDFGPDDQDYFQWTHPLKGECS